VRQALGPIDILVINGPGPPPATARDLDLDALRGGLDSLLIGQIQLTRECLADMVTQGWGRVLAIGSSGVESPIPNLAISNVGRGALAAYLKTLANEVAQDGVTVNMLLPGRIATERTTQLDQQAALRQGIDRSDVERQSAATIPLRRYGQPAEFGAYAAFLCSERASYVTGSRVRCDGGLLSSL
jgi:3-oxoacyl-[acyl-carrier protein] reductase